MARSRLAGCVVVLGLLFMGVPAAAQQPGLVLAFPPMDALDGADLLADLERRTNLTFDVALDLSDLAAWDAVQRDGVVHIELTRSDGRVDIHDVPTSTGGIVDTTRVRAVVSVRHETAALSAFLPLALAGPGVSITSDTDLATLVTTADRLTALLGLPARVPGEAWDVNREATCRAEVELPERPEWSYERAELGFEGSGVCTALSRGADPWEGRDNVRFLFFTDRPAFHVASGYWIAGESALLSRPALLNELRLHHESPNGAVGRYNPGMVRFDGVSLAVVAQWQAQSQPTGVTRQPCEPRWSSTVLQDAVSGRVLREEEYIPARRSCAPAVFGVRAVAPSATVVDRTLVRPGAVGGNAFAAQLEAVLGRPFVDVTTDGSMPGGIVTLHEDRYLLQIPAAAGQRGGGFVGDVVQVVERAGPITTTGPHDRLPPLSAEAGLHVEPEDFPVTLMGGAGGFVLVLRPGDGVLESLDAVRDLFLQLGYPVAEDARWIPDEGPVGAFVMHAQDMPVVVPCDCTRHALVPEPRVEGANEVTVWLDTGGRVVRVRTGAWLEVDAWGVVAEAAAVVRAEEALLADLASRVTFQQTGFRADMPNRELLRSTTFQGPDVYGIERTWTVTQFAHTAQVLHVAAEPPLHPDDARRAYGGETAWIAAVLVALAGLLLTRRFAP